MKTPAKIYIVLSTLFGMTGGNAYADIGLSVAQMNAQLDKCYQQSQLAQSANDKHKLSHFSCTRVLRNEWLTKEAESNARLNRAIVYMAKGYTEKAIKDFEKLLHKGTHQYKAHIALAQILESEQDYNNALGHYDSALAISDADPLLLKKRTRIAKRIALEKHQRLSLNKAKNITGNFNRIWALWVLVGHVSK